VVLERTFSVTAKSSWDVVVHLPENTADKPTVTVFRNDVSSVPRGKASLVVAHTATVPPADIRVNGEVLFENIGNGESLQLTVPVATYEVAIVPTGETEPVDGQQRIGQALGRQHRFRRPVRDPTLEFGSSAHAPIARGQLARAVGVV
jgi:hypothetical protein